MESRVGVLAAIALVVATVPSDSLLAQPGRAPDRADIEAVGLCERPWAVPSSTLRLAIVRITERRLCPGSGGLVSIVDDPDRDVATRSMAALALGELACHVGRGAGRTDGLSPAAIACLESATATDNPATLRQSAVRALGRGMATGALAAVIGLRDDPDPTVRYLAAQAATRLSGADHFDAPFRDAVIAEAVRRSALYELVDAPGVAP